MVQNIQATNNIQPELQPKPQDIQKSVSDLLVQLHRAVPDTNVLVDFDETLLLRNSTEEYLNTLQPRAVGVFFLNGLDFLKPWNWLPGQLRGEISRDWIRVLLATVLFPWTLLIWSWHARKLAQTQQNKPLVNALRSNPNLNILVATDGFRPIVAPVLKYIQIEGAELYACRLWLGIADRLKGKSKRLNETLGIDKVKNSIVITDSLNDRELLQIANHPYLIQWPQASFIQAMAAAYAPLLYTSKFKHSPIYLLRGILLDQWLILVLALSWIAPRPVLHAVGLLFLVISFWCIYELGYYENDYVAKHYEKHPNLKETGSTRPEAPLIEPWIWATIFAVPGLFLLSWATTTSATGFGTDLIDHTEWLGLIWFSLLVITRLVYWVFNHIDKRSRVWPYLLLQYSRLPAFVALTAMSPAGGVLLSAQTLISWIRYLIYRYHGNMQEAEPAILRLVTTSFLVAMLAITNGVSSILTWQMAAIFGFCLVRSRSKLPELLRQVKFVTDDHWSPSTAEK